MEEQIGMALYSLSLNLRKLQAICYKVILPVSLLSKWQQASLRQLMTIS